MNCSPQEINLCVLSDNLVKNIYTDIQSGSKKHTGIIAFVDTGNPVATKYQKDQEVSHD